MSRGSIIVVLGAVSLSVGCVDTGEKFAAFETRATKSKPVPRDASGDAAQCSVGRSSVTGQYLLALSVTLAPTKPIVAMTGLSTPAFGGLDGGTGLLLEVQPLSATDRLTPVGPKLVLGPFPVSATGTFRADISGLEVPGTANPVTGGDIAANVVLTGNLCGDGRSFCGVVTGKVERPLVLDLVGSTFTLTRVEPLSDPPVRPPIDCAGTLSDPL
ncbi:MAG TPA: hypothetical protein VF395_08390 [Polyangiaceae bacterium]